MGTELVEHWFNRRWRTGRRDVYLTRDSHGWHVRAHRGGPDGVEVVHHFTDAADAHAMLLRLLETTPPQDSDWAKMPRPPSRITPAAPSGPDRRS